MHAYAQRAGQTVKDGSEAFSGHRKQRKELVKLIRHVIVLTIQVFLCSGFGLLRHQDIVERSIYAQSEAQ